MPEARWNRRLVLLVFSGISLGFGGATFHYAKGTSYLSNDPAACANCHIMQEQYDGWQKSSHHNVATCNDCHTPHDFLGKYMSKMSNGYHHSLAFTLQNFQEPIRIKPHNKKILLKNCLDCHSDFVHEILEPTADSMSQDCMKCHADVGHGR